MTPEIITITNPVEIKARSCWIFSGDDEATAVDTAKRHNIPQIYKLTTSAGQVTYYVPVLE